MRPKEYFQGKKVLVMGLGLFGGGEYSAKWLLKQGAQVTVTDLKEEKELEKTLKQFTKNQRKKIAFVLGRHLKTDFKKADIVVVNPGVPRESEYLKIAKEHGAHFENVASIFFRFLPNPVVGVTGTRGKTTTVKFAAQLLSDDTRTVATVGSSEVPLLKELDTLRKDPSLPVVVELSSWQLELLSQSEKAPRVSVITNLYADHLNRYAGMKAYARAKANIFRDQTENDFLVLNNENEWTSFFEKQKPKSHVYYFSERPLPKRKEGVYVSKAGSLRVRLNGKDQKYFEIKEFTEKYGKHNLSNFLAATLAVSLMDSNVSITKKDALSLETVPYRQEVVWQKQGKKIVNDTAATSPDATVTALERFSEDEKKSVVLLTGGTDKNLEYADLARKIKKTVKNEDLILLEGSGTEKLIQELEKIEYFGKREPNCHETLRECFENAYELFENQSKAVLLFSPAAASFEKFTNEIDRGEQFYALVKKVV